MPITANRLSSLFVLDQDQALEFYTGVLGLEIGTDADLGFMRWLTVMVPGDTKEILLEVPGPPQHDPETAEVARGLVTKGASAGWLAFTADDVDAVHADLVAKGVEITDPLETRDYGRDFGLRDPFGNPIRIGQVPLPGQ